MKFFNEIKLGRKSSWKPKNEKWNIQEQEIFEVAAETTKQRWKDSNLKMGKVVK